jgi:meiotically up-regulated gene 157 (Mug157) protein
MNRSPSQISRRPAPEDRKFVSPAVEEVILEMTQVIADPELSWLFENCYPNTLDTTVEFRERGGENGEPDTFVITGDIDAMWLRDSAAQVWPYLPLARHDPHLRQLLAGVIRRQSQCIRFDPYANAFLADPNGTDQWVSDYTEMKPGIHERKWEIDSLCYPVRLAYAYWKETGDTAPLDAGWEQAMDLVVQTFREQQRKDGPGPYQFQRGGELPASDSLTVYGTPIKPVGLICSRFRPSDDATTYQFLIPSNFFAVVSLNQMAEMLDQVRHSPQKALQVRALAEEVAVALAVYAPQAHPTRGSLYAYEVDGLGNTLFMDDSNVPSLLSLPYLGVCEPSDPLYQATRSFIWSEDNPWFFRGKFTGVGGPHLGPDTIWPMSLIVYALTSVSEAEVASCLTTLQATHAGTGFMHETFHKDDPADYTRSWFAWANTLFGELILQTARRYPNVLAVSHSREVL